MWDVKILVLNSSGLTIASFYLNYVGCKDIDKQSNSVNLVMFYLNYVGCKATAGILFGTRIS